MREKKVRKKKRKEKGNFRFLLLKRIARRQKVLTGYERAKRTGTCFLRREMARHVEDT